MPRKWSGIFSKIDWRGRESQGILKFQIHGNPGFFRLLTFICYTKQKMKKTKLRKMKKTTFNFQANLEHLKITSPHLNCNSMISRADLLPIENCTP